MPFKLIKGAFHVVGYRPDGDSLRFKAKKKKNWELLEGRTVGLNKKDHAQLRIEAIDAPETHYSLSKAQPKDLARASRDRLLDLLNIKNVVWSASHYKVVSADDGVPGYILSRKAEMYARPVAFAFEGRTKLRDGSDVFLDGTLLRKSANYKMMLAGLVYPTYYKGLFWDLRNILTAAAIQAYNSNRGVWPWDWTNIGVPMRDQAAIEEEYMIMPKMFRRLIKYNNSGTTMGFKDWLADKGGDPILVLRTGQLTNFDTIVEEKSGKVRLTEYPEDIVFMS